MKKVKRFLAILLTFVMTLGLIPTSVMAEPTVQFPQLKLKTELAEDGKTVTAEVKAAPYNKLASVQFELHYDTEKLTAAKEDITVGGFFDKAGFKSYNVKKEEGKEPYVIAAGTTEGSITSTEEETFLTVKFKVNESAEGNLDFELKNFVMQVVDENGEDVDSTKDEEMGKPEDLKSTLELKKEEPESPVEPEVPEGEYKVTLNKEGNGTASLSRTSAALGDLVTVSVKPDEGNTVWKVTGSYTDASGAVKNINFTKKDAETYTVAMPEADIAVTAYFAENSKTRITKLIFATDKNDESTYFEYTPEFDKDHFTYETTVPDYLSSFWYYTEMENGDQGQNYPMSGGSINYFTPGWGTMSVSSVGRYLKVADDRDKFNGSNGGKTPLVTIYEIKINKKLSLSGLDVNETMSPAFDKAVTSYSAYVPADQETVAITAKPYAYGGADKVSVGGIEAKTGETVELPVKWDSSDEMQVKIFAAKEGMESIEYTLTLKKEPQTDTPTFVLQPKAGQTYVDTAENTDAISVRASANGTLSYQWYKNTVESTEGAVPVEGATESSFEPKVSLLDKTEMYYYYCKVTNKNEKGTFSTDSDIVNITVISDPTPYDVKLGTVDGSEIPKEGYVYKQGDEIKPLKVTYKTRTDAKEDEISVQYLFWNLNENGSGSGSYSNDGTYTFSNLYNSAKYIVPEVRLTVNGKNYSKKSDDKVLIKVMGTGTTKPKFSTQPKSATYVVGAQNVLALSVRASFGYGDNSSSLYQWYVSRDNKNFEAVEDATNASVLPEILTEPGTLYYKCEATSKLESYDGNTYTETEESDVATIEYNKLEDMVEEELWDGEGTAEKPYLISDIDDLKLIYTLVNNKGFFMSGAHFEMTNDIELPADWIPLGGLKPGTTSSGSGKNIYPFSGIFDGAGHTLTVAEGGLPLFGYVRGATVKNLNLYGTRIDGYGLVNNYTVDYGPTGSYGDWTAGEGVTINIDNVTIKAGTNVKKAGFLGGFASAANICNIDNCTAEKGVVIGYDKSVGCIGSFTGELSGTMNNCHSAADVYGTNWVGGLAGSKGEAMGTSRILNSSFSGNVVATGNYVGGIYGTGYGAPSAPNTPCVSIQNCYITGNITGVNKVGGILGGEPVCTQCWANGIGYIQNNYFAGTIKGEEYVGGIIGYMKSLDRYNIISNNYYLEGCGAQAGLAGADIVDTTVKVDREDAQYVTTSTYCRNDDPLGADADKLTKSATSAEFADGTVAGALNNGANSNNNWSQNGTLPGFGEGTILYVKDMEITGYKKEYTTLEDFTSEGIKVVVTMSDGSKKEVPAEEVEFSGYINTPGTWSINALYKGCMKIFSVTVKQATDEQYAERVMDAIEAIGEITLESEEAVQNARTLYDELTDAQKELVENYDVLTKAEENLEQLKADTEAVKPVEEAIEAIGEVTLESYGKIQAARTAYDGLTDAQKKLVGNYETLKEAEAKYQELKDAADKQEEVDKAAAKSVEDMINAIGEVTLEKGSAIEAARAAFDALTAAQKDYLSEGVENALKTAETTYAELVKAELEALIKKAQEEIAAYKDMTQYREEEKAELEALITEARAVFATAADKEDLAKQQAEYQKSMDEVKTDAQLIKEENAEAAKAVDELIEKIGTVTMESEEAIAAAEKAYGELNEEQQALVTGKEKLTAAREALEALKAAAEADRQAASEVVGKIEAIGEVTLESEEAIQAAQDAYDALTETQRALVTNKDVLEQAWRTLESLKDDQEGGKTIINEKYKVSLTGQDIMSDMVLDVTPLNTDDERVTSMRKEISSDYALTKLYEIQVYQNGYKVALAHDAQLTVEVGEKYNGQTMTMLYMADGKIEKLTGKAENGKLTVTITKQGAFGVVVKADKTAGGNTTGGNITGGNKNGTVTGNAKTGDEQPIALWISLLGMAALGMIGVKTSKRKRQSK